MTSERTPLRNRLQQGNTSYRNRRIAGLIGVIAVTAIVIGYWVNNAGPSEIPLKVSTTAHTPNSLVDPAHLFCGITNQETGYIKLSNKENDSYFYWFHPSRSNRSTDPLVIWLTGGPGCSSLMALFHENGPCLIQPDLTTRLNPYSWNVEANVLWLDQPTNVGFSVGDASDMDRDETNVQDNIYWFIHGFLDKHPEFEGRDFYLTGESYAGHYVPAAAHKIWMENKAVKETNATIRINLKGIAIGNGLTNPSLQATHALDMVHNSYNITLMSEEEYQDAKANLPRCEKVAQEVLKDLKDFNDSRILAGLAAKLGNCTDALSSPAIKAHRNPYDIRLPCKPSPNPMNCYDTTYIATYLNDPVSKSFLNISHKKWEECSGDVALAFVRSGDINSNVEGYVADLLNEGDIRVLLYAGDADTVCNWSGNQAWARALEWKHKEEFNAAEQRPYITSKEKTHAGVVQSDKHQFTFLRLFNAGHMVPLDQPVVAFDMINKFFKDEDFYKEV